MIKYKLKIILITTYFFSACQTNSTFDQLDVNTIDFNTIDLTKITGEAPSAQSFFDSALWSAILSAALLATLSSTGSTYTSKKMNESELDSEWIE